MSSQPEFPAQCNPAVRHCCEAYRIGYARAFEKERDPYLARNAGANAYRNAMPPLFGVRNIRNFIACVSSGTLIGAIGRLQLYPAPLCRPGPFSARRIRQAKKKSGEPSSRKSRSGAIQSGKKTIQEPFSASVSGTQPI